MTCKEFLALLDREGVAAAQSGAEHLQRCPRCQGELARWQEVERQLAASGEDEVPPFLHERIMAHVRAEGKGRVRQAAVRWRPAWAGPLLALVVLAGLGGVGVWQALRAKAPVQAPPELADAAAPKPVPMAVAPTPTVPRPMSAAAAPRTHEAARSSGAKKPLLDAAPEEGGLAMRGGEPKMLEERSQGLASRDAEKTAQMLPVGPAATPVESMEEVAPAFEAQGVSARSREQAKSSVRAGVAPPRESRCQLLDDDSVPVATLWLPSHAVPREGSSWPVSVAEGGAVTVRDEGGRELPHVASLIVERAPRLPPPGRYRLTQAPLPEY